MSDLRMPLKVETLVFEESSNSFENVSLCGCSIASGRKDCDDIPCGRCYLNEDNRKDLTKYLEENPSLYPNIRKAIGLPKEDIKDVPKVSDKYSEYDKYKEARLKLPISTAIHCNSREERDFIVSEQVESTSPFIEKGYIRLKYGYDTLSFAFRENIPVYSFESYLKADLSKPLKLDKDGNILKDEPFVVSIADTATEEQKKARRAIKDIMVKCELQIQWDFIVEDCKIDLNVARWGRYKEESYIDIQNRTYGKCRVTNSKVISFEEWLHYTPKTETKKEPFHMIGAGKIQELEVEGTIYKVPDIRGVAKGYEASLDGFDEENLHFCEVLNINNCVVIQCNQCILNSSTFGLDKFKSLIKTNPNYADLKPLLTKQDEDDKTNVPLKSEVKVEPVIESENKIESITSSDNSIVKDLKYNIGDLVVTDSGIMRKVVDIDSKGYTLLEGSPIKWRDHEIDHTLTNLLQRNPHLFESESNFKDVYKNSSINEEPMKERFKPGDRVKVIANTSGHRFKIGSIITVRELSENDYSFKEGVWYLTDKELELHVEDSKPSILESKFKVGDKVRIVACTHNHGFKIGTVVTIKSYGSDFYSVEEDRWVVTPEEIELVERATPVSNVQESKFKIGDKVKIVANNCSHYFQIGSIKTITFVTFIGSKKGARYYFNRQDTSGYFAKDEDLELITEETEVRDPILFKEKTSIIVDCITYDVPWNIDVNITCDVEDGYICGCDASSVSCTKIECGKCLFNSNNSKVFTNLVKTDSRFSMFKHLLPKETKDPVESVSESISLVGYGLRGKSSSSLIPKEKPIKECKKEDSLTTFSPSIYKKFNI